MTLFYYSNIYLFIIKISCPFYNSKYLFSHFSKERSLFIPKCRVNNFIDYAMHQASNKYKLFRTLFVSSDGILTWVFFFILFHIYLNLYKLVIFNTCAVSIHVSVVQLNPIHPASHEHIPSVCRHVLQLGEQTYEQCFPQYPFTQAEIQNRPSCNATLPWVSCFFFKGLTAHHLQNTN